MQSWSSKDFTADRAWGAGYNFPAPPCVWTDQPYIWHQ